MEKVNSEKKVRKIVNPIKYIRSKACCSDTCAETKKTIWMIAIIVAVFYGLIWVPSKQLELDRFRAALAQQSYFMDANMAQLNLSKIQNSCKVVASNSLAAYEKQSEEKISDEQKKKLADQFFANCLFVEGLQVNGGNRK